MARLASALLLFGTACAAPRMSLPLDLGVRAEAMPLSASSVSAEEDRLEFGPYEIHGIREEPMSTTTRGGAVSREQTYSFRVKDEDQHDWLARCQSSATAAGVERAALKGVGAVKLTCTIDRPGAPARWRLSLAGEGSEGGMKAGELWGAKRQLRIQSNHSGKIGGFDIAFEDRPVAAVQTAADRVVWMDPALAEELKPVVAVSAAGLILFDHLNAAK